MDRFTDNFLSPLFPFANMLTDLAAHSCGSDEIEKAAIPCEEGEEHEDLDPRACWLMEQPHIFCFRSDVFYGFAIFVWKFSGDGLITYLGVVASCLCVNFVPLAS